MLRYDQVTCGAKLAVRSCLGEFRQKNFGDRGLFANSRGELRLPLLARQLGRGRRSHEAAAREGANRHPSHHGVRVEPVCTYTEAAIS